MKQRLSSIWSLPLKLLPLFLIGYGSFWVFKSLYNFNEIRLDWAVGFIVYTLACLGSSLLILPLKTVYLEQDRLLISSYTKTTCVPFQNIEKVIDYTGLLTGTAPPRIVIVLRDNSESGRTISFMPRMSLVPYILETLEPVQNINHDVPSRYDSA